MTAFTQLVINQDTQIFSPVIVTDPALGHLVLGAVKYGS